MKLVRTTRIHVSLSGGEAALAGPSPEAGAIGILVVEGPDVTFRAVTEGDPLLKRIRNNPDVLCTEYPDRICYVPAASVRAFVDTLKDVYIVEIRVGGGQTDVNNVSFGKLRSDRQLFMAVCGQWYRRLRLPVLLFYLALVLANFLYAPSVNRKYEERRCALEVAERRNRAESDVTERQRKLMTEFIGLRSEHTAGFFDRIASVVPGDMRLTQIAKKEDGYHIKGETEDAAAVLVFADSLGACFGTMRILSYGVVPGKETLGFEIVVRP